MSKRFDRRVVLILAIVLVLVIVAGRAVKAPLNNSDGQLLQDVTPQEAFHLIEQNRDNAHFIILDVRTASEFAGGHIEGALNIDVNLASFRDEMARLDNSDTYLVYCRTGNRSRNAIAIMTELGFTSIYHLEKGIVGWTGAGLEVVPAPQYSTSQELGHQDV